MSLLRVHQLLVSFCLFLQGTLATHFAFGTVSWTKDDPVGAPSTYNVNLELALRTNFFNINWDNFDPDNGQYVSVKFVARIQWQPHLCDCPQCEWDYDGNSEHLYNTVDSYFDEILIDCHTTTSHTYDAADTCYWNENKSTGSTKTLYCIEQAEIEARVRYVEDNYFVGRMIRTITPPSVVMTDSNGNPYDVKDHRWRISFMGKGRINNLREANGDVLFQMQSVLDPDLIASPQSVGFPREYAGLDKPWTFYLPGVSPENRPLTYFVTGNTNNKEDFHTGLMTALPGSTEGNPMDVSRLADEGIVTWTPGNLGLYAVQFMIADDVGGFCPLDLIIEVIDIC